MQQNQISQNLKCDSRYFHPVPSRPHLIKIERKDGVANRGLLYIPSLLYKNSYYLTSYFNCYFCMMFRNNYFSLIKKHSGLHEQIQQKKNASIKCLKSSLIF